MSAEFLPLDNSFIPFDLLLRIGIAHFENNNLTVKSLFAGLPHSEMGIRYHFCRLLAKGWIEVHPSTSDRRSKLVIPTSKLLDQLMLLDQEFAKVMKQHVWILIGNSSTNNRFEIARQKNSTILGYRMLRLMWNTDESPDTTEQFVRNLREAHRHLENR